MTPMLRRISDRITDQTARFADQTARFADQTAAGYTAVSKSARDGAENLYGTVREYPKASAAIVVGSVVFAAAIWALVTHPPRFLRRRTAAARTRVASTSHTQRRRRVRAGRAATA